MVMTGRTKVFLGGATDYPLPKKRFRSIRKCSTRGAYKTTMVTYLRVPADRCPARESFSLAYHWVPCHRLSNPWRTP